MNHIKTLFLMTLLTVLLVLAGGAIAGEAGLIFALVFAVVLNVFTWWNSDRIAIRMTRSQPLPRNRAPKLYDMVERLCARAKLPMPRLYLTPSQQPNAFATGRSPRHSAVAVTEGLLRHLDAEEIEGVIAHELAHIRNRDTLISTVAAVMAGALTAVARIGTYGMLLGGGRGRGGNPIAILLAIILAPIAAMLIRMAVSRSREFAADRTAAAIAGSPSGLVSALRKLDRTARTSRMQVSEAASHMFIVNPLSAGGGMSALFSTHPPMERRIERLQRLQAPGSRPKLR